jgi:hypothetical protein
VIRRGERFGGRRPENEIGVAAPCPHQVAQQQLAQRRRDRHGAGLAVFGGDLAGLRVPSPLDADHVCVQVDPVRPERHQLAAAQPGVHRGSPRRPVGLRERSQ